VLLIDADSRDGYSTESAFKLIFTPMENRMNPPIPQPDANARFKRTKGTVVLKATAIGALLCCATLSHAVDFGPDGMFSLTGFAEVKVGLQDDYCLKCQVNDFSSKQFREADAIIPGKKYDTVTTAFWQFQPYLGAKYNLGGGYEVSALLSQRWRDETINGEHVERRLGGTVDVPDFLYDKSIALRNEEYGSVRIGTMLARGWSVADAPYGNNVGLAYAWGSSGAGYGMLTNAIRLGTRPLDFAEGDLYVELTYDQGNTNFKRLTPAFYELYAQYHKGDLVVDAVFQDATNGGAGAWGQSPFTGVTPFALNDRDVIPGGIRFSGTHQSIAMLMARYQVNAAVEVSGGIRQNNWSGSSIGYDPATDWKAGFNVDYSNLLLLGSPGYPASSVDLLLGGRYRTGPWSFVAGMVYLGAADTKNPSDRGQGNTALFNTLGVRYDYAPGLELGATGGMVHYGQKGLSPLSMPGNASFSNVDSRISQDGSWLTVGMLYKF
jgi:hypothetical protein